MTLAEANKALRTAVEARLAGAPIELPDALAGYMLTPAEPAEEATFAEPEPVAQMSPEQLDAAWSGVAEKQRQLHARLREPDAAEPPRVVGFAGYAGAGKNAAADALGGVVLGFSDPLYAGLAVMLGVGEEALRDRATKELPLPLGRSPRHLLQTLGTEWGRELVRSDMWIYRARQRVAEAARLGADVIAFSDVRFRNELEFLRDELGGQVWWIERHGVVAGTHASDNSLTADQCDRVIKNDGSRDQLTWAVRAAWREAGAAASSG
jgi:hypothetical protein